MSICLYMFNIIIYTFTYTLYVGNNKIKNVMKMNLRGSCILSEEKSKMTLLYQDKKSSLKHQLGFTYQNFHLKITHDQRLI